MLKLKAHVVISMLILTIATQNLFGITVTSNLDPGAPGSGTGVCVGTNTGSGLTLREAIELVNLGGTDRTIEFDLPAGKETIFICSLLPIITPDDVTVDGSNTAGSGVQVTIDGTNLPTGNVYGLRYIGSSRCITRNITITNISTTGGPNHNITGLQLNSSPDSVIENVTVTNLSASGSNADIAGISINGARTVVRGSTVSNLTTIGPGGSDINAIVISSSGTVVIGGPGSEAVFIDNLVAERAFARGVSFFNSDSGLVENTTITNLTTMPSGVSCVGIFCDPNSQGTDVNACTIEDFISQRDSFGITLFGRSDFVSNCDIRNLRSVDQTSGGTTGNVVGIDLTASNATQSVLQGCSNNTIENLVSGDHTANSTGFVQGIFCDRIFQGGCNNNVIRHLTSGASSISTSGAVTGVRIDESVIPNGTNTGFDSNVIQDLTSGGASTASGNVLGIDVGIDVEMSLNSNEISHLTSGPSATDNSGDIAGIQIAGSVTDETVANKVCSLSSGEAVSGTSGDVAGVEISGSIALDFNENEVYSLRSADAEVTGNITGLAVDQARNCSENIVTGLQSGLSSIGESGTVYGIKVGSGGVGTEIVQSCSLNKVGINLSTVGTECFCPELPLIGTGSEPIFGTDPVCEGSDFLSFGLISGDSPVVSGDVIGISVESMVGNDCNQNMVANLESGGVTSGTGIGTGGTELFSSGNVVGIDVPGSIGGDCSGNSISNSLTGDAPELPGFIRGIDVSIIAGSCNNNTISSLTGGESTANNGNTAIAINATLIAETCDQNCIKSIVSGNALIDTADAIGINAVSVGGCSANTIHTIKSGDALTGDSGNAYGIKSSGISGPCSYNWITVIESGISPMLLSGDAAAILVDGDVSGDASNNVIGADNPSLGSDIGSQFGSDTFSSCFDGSAGSEPCALGIRSGASGGASGTVWGIKADTVHGSVDSNNIECLTSGDSTFSTSSPAVGIATLQIAESCNQNCIKTITSGNALGSSAVVAAIESGGIGSGSADNDCNANIIHDIRSGDSATGNTGNSFGILTGSVGGSCDNNWITRIKSGFAPSGISGETAAIDVTGSIGGSCSDNAIGVGLPLLGSEYGSELFFSCFDGVAGTEFCSLGIVSGNSGDSSGDSKGIDVFSVANDASNNNIQCIMSGDSASSASGNVFGLESNQITGSCNTNTVATIISGLALLDSSGNVVGINARLSIGQDCNDNDVSQLTSGESKDASGNVDGILLGDAGGTGANVVAQNCSGNTVTDLISGESCLETSGNVIGISISNTIAQSCNNNEITDLVSSIAPKTGDVTGIKSSEIGSDNSGNQVSNLMSGETVVGSCLVGSGTGGTEMMPAPTDSGNVVGIDTEQVGGNTNINCIKNLLSGEAAVNSGSTIGIDAGDIDADCSGNTIHQVISGDAIAGSSGDSYGIQADAIGGQCSGNWITSIESGSSFISSSGDVRAVLINGTLGGSFSNNSIGGNSPIIGSEFGSEVYFSCFDGSDGTEFCALGVKSGASNGDTGSVAGVEADTITTDFDCNTIRCIMSGTSLMGSSGNAAGVDTNQIDGSANKNCVTNIISGDAAINSGSAFGLGSGSIGSGSLNGDCSGNTIHQITTGDATSGSSGNAFGIVATSVGGACDHNWVTTINSGEAPTSTSGISTAIQVSGIVGDSCSSNAIGIGTPIIGSEFGTGVYFNCFDGVAGTELCALGIQSGGAGGNSGVAKGIKADLVTTDASSNNIQCLISGDSSTANSGEVIGIDSGQIMGNCNVNTVATLISGLALLGASGEVDGIDVNLSVEQDCNNNTILRLTSGKSENDSGHVHGISLGEGYGTSAGIAVQNCNDNLISFLTSGESNNDVSGTVIGVVINSNTSQSCDNNIIDGLISGQALRSMSGDVTGIEVANSIGGNSSANIITNLVSSTATRTGDIAGINSVTINGDSEFNFISGLMSGNTISGTEVLGSGTSMFALPTTSGDVTGIDVDQSIGRDCSFNTMSSLISGDAETESGRVHGISLGNEIGSGGVAVQNCNSNQLSDLESGESTTSSSGEVTGIFVNNEIAQDCSDNQITALTSGEALRDVSGEVTGIDVLAEIGANCSSNSIINLDSSTALQTGDVTGIETDIVGANCSGNNVTNLTSGDTVPVGTNAGSGSAGTGPMPTTSGDVTGIDINRSVGQDCNSNSVTTLTSGVAETDSGRVFGISLGDDNGTSDVTATQNCNGNTVNTLTSGVANTDSSGDVTGIFVNSDIAQNCSSNIISDLTSSAAPDISGEVNGIDVVDTIGGECTDNTVSNLTNSSADITQDSTGIEVNNVGGFLARNMISNVISEPGITTSGNVYGINVENQAQGTTFNNTITNLTASGTTAVGIHISELQADALNNTVIGVELLESGTNGSASLSAEAAGILIGDMSNNAQATCNDTEQIQSVREGNASGIWIKNANSILVSNNTSRDITGLNTAAAHGIRLGNKNTSERVQGSLGEENLIRNTDGGANNGFGITIENNQSTQNKLFGNSISEIETLAINYENPPVDGILTINSITCLEGDMLRVQGNLIPLVAPIGEYRIELFASPNNTPPESYQLIGAFNYTPAPPAFNVTVNLLRPLLASEFVTATATALAANNKNTTPVSDPLDGCNSIGGGTDIDPICEFISVCDPNCTVINPGPPPSTSCPVPVPTS